MSVSNTTDTSSTPICGEIAAQCICHKRAGHVEDGDQVHECDQRRCTGAWSTAGGTFRIVRLPFPVDDPQSWPEGLL